MFFLVSQVVAKIQP